MDVVYVELRVPPDAILVSLVRRFASEFFYRLVGDADMTSRLSVAVQELIENAVKYSESGETTCRLEVARDAGVAKITTTNQAHPTNVAELRSHVEEICRAPDPARIYHEKLRLSGQRAGSGLGLARIRGEGSIELDCVVSGNTVRVIASAPLPARRGT
jgi:hypothetical protein